MASYLWPPELSGSGTVTSVGLADGSTVPIFTISGSPVTGSGTLTFTLSTETANKVFAGPTTGAAAQPAFRSLVAADVSSLFGNLTDVGTDGITITGGTGVVLGSGTSIAQHVADSTHNGYLSSTDWSTFNGKQASGNYITALTGDVTAAGPGSVAATVAKIQGTTVSGTTGSTNVVFSTAPTLSNPVVGTQTQGDASTKAASTAYVDTAVANAIAGVNPAVAVQAATTAASDTSGFTYNNGASGIGAFFTGTVNTAITIDGYTFTAVGQRLLVKNDTQSPSGAFNGVYYVTQIQTAILAPILTRALDYNQPSDMNNTGAIPVINGTVNGTTQWVITSLVVTVGTTPITYTRFSVNPSTILINPMTTLGDTIYEDATPTPVRLAGNITTTKKFQTQTGNGSISAAPGWNTIVGSDLPNPSSSTLGGIQSAAAVSNQWIASISTSGVPALTQPAFTNISGSVAAAQMPALTGDVTTSAGAVATTAAATQANIATLSKSTGVAVHGTNTNDAAAAGYVGEYVESKNASVTNYPTSGQYGDATSISLTAGDWDVSYMLVTYPGAAATISGVAMGISTTSGNSSTGLSTAENYTTLYSPQTATNSYGQPMTVPPYRMSLSATTTVYAKVFAAYTSSAPQYAYRISARRVR